jgi:NAD(P)H-nitrite reductase large subunit
MNHLIIGAGPAGMTAAAWLRRLDPGASVTVLSKEEVPPYAKMALPYRLSGETDEGNIFLPVPEGASLLLGKEVAEVDHYRRRVRTLAGEAFGYDRLLVAAGAVPEKPEVKGAHLPFVFTVRDLPDVARMKSRVRPGGGRAVIAGAGPVSMETGDALHKLGMEITYVVSSDRIFSSMLDRPAAEFVRRRIEARGVEILTGDDITEIGENGEVSLKSGGRRTCDLVVFGKGVRPCAGFLAGSGITVKKGICVDERQETDLPGIFAAGDAVETMDIAYGEPRVNAIWPAAVEQGRVAAGNMCGVRAAYGGSLARNVLRVFGVSIFTAGKSRDEGPGVLREEDGGAHRKVVIEGGVLKGFAFVGDVPGEGLYVGMIGKKIGGAPEVGRLLKGRCAWARMFAGLSKLPQ